MEFSTELTDAVATLFKGAIVEIVTQQPDSKAAGLEHRLRHLLKQAGAQALGKGLSALDEPYPEAHIACHCRGMAAYQFRRSTKTFTVFGWVAYRHAYYLCAQCPQGKYPLDQCLGLEPGQVSAGLVSLLVLAGVETAFEEGCELVERFFLIEISENTLRKETQTFGQLQAQSEQDWQAESQDAAYLQARQRTQPAHPKRLYGSIDGSHFPIGEEWRELKAGSWYEVEKVGNASNSEVGQLDELRAGNMRYYCDITESETFGRLLWATGVQSGADLADEIDFVADGAAWIWKPGGTQLPRSGPDRGLVPRRRVSHPDCRSRV